jgi:N-acetylmuramoyl-L-alanine amidase
MYLESKNYYFCRKLISNLAFKTNQNILMSIKHHLLFFCFIAASILLAKADNLLIPEVKCVVIDAGHGGKDPGAIGFKKSKEKDVTLAVALKLGTLISKHFPDVKVVYTRKTDIYLSLESRAKIANDNKADLFISIHCNAIDRPTAFGVETYVMGVHKNAANLEVAKKENSTILLEKDYLEKYDGFNPNSPEAYIIFSLYQNAFLNNSLIFASAVQQELAGRIKFFDRGVKQAGFWVLYRTAMPGALIELGFISNPDDEKYMVSEKGQDAMSKAILNAFAQYKHVVEGNPASTFKPIYSGLLLYSDLLPKKEDEKPATDLTNQFVAKSSDSPTICEADSAVVLKVQFATFNEVKPLNSREFEKIPMVSMYNDNRLYKYTAGCETSFEDAQKVLKIVKEAGYKDAFIIGFEKGERITTTKAVELLKNKN